MGKNILIALHAVIVAMSDRIAISPYAVAIANHNFAGQGDCHQHHKDHQHLDFKHASINRIIILNYNILNV